MEEVYEVHFIGEAENEVRTDDRTCYGRECFFGSHLITTILSLMYVLSSYLFYRLTNCKYVYAIKL
jgi:hypothetical protein